MSTEFIKALLDYGFYDKYKTIITEDLVPKEFKSLYNTIIYSHTNNKVSLTIPELKSLHCSLNPTISKSNSEFTDALIAKLSTVESFSPEVQETILFNKVAERLANELAMTVIGIGECKTEYSTEQAQLLLDKLKKLKNRTKDTRPKAFNVKELFKESGNLKWKFNLPDLQNTINGIGPGYFGIMAGRPDSGKTATYISLVAAPNGFMAQGAKVHILGNEEGINRIEKRILSSYTGWNKEYIESHIDEVESISEYLKDKVFPVEAFGMSIGDIEAYLTDKEVDILIIDQLDKVHVGGKYNNNEEKLRVIYVNAREIAKRYKCAVIGICQASFAAHNKLYYGFECLEGSKTGKGAECDWCITIGMETNNGQGDTGFRVANVPKNKINGKKSPVTFVLESDISRIHA